MNRGPGKDNGTREQRVSPSSCCLRPAARLLPLLLLASLALLPLTGCTSAPVNVDKSLMAERGATARNEGVAERYRIGCPDVLEVTVRSRARHLMTWSDRRERHYFDLAHRAATDVASALSMIQDEDRTAA